MPQMFQSTPEHFPTSYIQSKHSAQLQIFFFFNDTATTEIYTLSLHDALPIWRFRRGLRSGVLTTYRQDTRIEQRIGEGVNRSEEHTSELQSQSNLVCRLLLEKKKTYALRLSGLAD